MRHASMLSAPPEIPAVAQAAIPQPAREGPSNIEAALEKKDVLLAAIRRRLNRPDDAEDVLHDVYVQILRKKQPLTNPGGVCYTIARRLAWWHRQQEGRATFVEIDVEAFSTPDCSRAIEEAQWLQRVFDSLKPTERRILKCRLSGYKDEEIARVLGVSIFTVRKYMSGIVRPAVRLIQSEQA